MLSPRGGAITLYRRLQEPGRGHMRPAEDLSTAKPARVDVDGRCNVVVQARYPPIGNGSQRSRLRSAAGSATIVMFAKHGTQIDEVVVVMTTSPAFSRNIPAAASLLEYSRHRDHDEGTGGSTPSCSSSGSPGTGLGRHQISDPLAVLGPFSSEKSRSRMTMADGLNQHREACGLLLARPNTQPVREEIPAAELSPRFERIHEEILPGVWHRAVHFWAFGGDRCGPAVTTIGLG